MKKVSDKYLKRINTLMKTVGLTADLQIELTSAEPGDVTGEIVVQEKHLNFHKNVHGGTYVSLADTIAGLAVSSTGRNCVTVNGNINYLSASNGCRKIICHAKLLEKNENLAWVEADIQNENGDLLFTCKFSFFLLEEIDF